MLRGLEIRVLAAAAILLAPFLVLSVAAAPLSCEQGVQILEREGLGGAEAALALFDKAISENPDAEEPYLAAAKTCLLCFEFSDERNPAWLARGLRYVDRLLERNPASIDAHVMEAQILLDLESPHAAVLALKKALRLDPAHPTANLVYLAHLVSLGEKDAAVAFARSSGEHFAENAVIMKQYGNLLLRAGYWEESTPFFNQALSMDEEDDAEILKGLGAAHYQMGHYVYAASMYGKAHEWDPEDLSSLAQISLCFARAGRFEDAAIYTERYLAENPNDASARRQLAFYYEKLGRPERAEEARRLIGDGQKDAEK